jgi:tRNA modification GTPase
MHAGLSDTIFALASGQGRAALAVVRVSGPGCSDILRALCGVLPQPRRAVLRRLHNSAGDLLDQALVLWFAGPSSYTGEDCCELQLHGGVAVIEGVMLALAQLGARAAGPGEFTRRAVTRGRMDLLEAEAVADLIDAETAAQRDQALQQMGGALGAIYADWAARLLRLLAQQEALIDFPDEDLPSEIVAAMHAQMLLLRSEMGEHLNDGGRGERLRAGLVFAIAGPPNVGKSTLINALCQREVAIVSPVAGTTRDVLEARLELAGIPVTLLDTAGLRDTDDPIEAEGVRRARARVASADLVIALSSSAAGFEADSSSRVLPVMTKSDLHGVARADGLAVSARTGAGMDQLVAALERIARELAGTRGSPALSRARHRMAIEEAMACLDAAMAAELAELCGEELRVAVHALGRVTGSVGVEDVLDSVFSQFCIGK